MSEDRPRDPQLESAERIRLLELQLDYLRAETQHLTNERHRLVYSVSGHIYRWLRPIEHRIVDTANALWRRLCGADTPAPEPAPPQALPAASTTALPARRLLVDVTGTVKRDAATGIQRVVKEVVRALYAAPPEAIEAIAVRAENGRLFEANGFVAALTGAAAAKPDREIAIAPGDRFFGLSDSWNAFDELSEIFALVRAEGGVIVTCIFDLIPELYPHACHEVTVPRYHAWLRRALIESDAFLAISRTVADELADYIKAAQLPHRPGLKIGWFHCGSDLAATRNDEPRKQIAAAVAGATPTFLTVGTLEPRKGHRIALRAFDSLWAHGSDARFVIVGRRGWLEEALVNDITTHPEFGRRLFWFDDATDSDLAFLYDHAAALVFASYAEGFGLPIVEAARRGRPVICSDIPVFREVGQDGALYFRVNDADALAAAISDFMSGAQRAEPQKVLQESWADTARRIVDVVAREDWRHRLG